MEREVAVTGIGVLASPGVGAECYWAGLMEARSRVRGITRFDAARIPVRIAAEIDDAQLAPHVEGAELTPDGRLYLYAGLAVGMALDDAGLDGNIVAPERCGVVLGTSTGPTAAALFSFLQGFRPAHPGGAGPAAWMDGFPASVARSLSARHGFRGFSSVISTGCAAGADAVGVAMEAIRWGHSDVMLAVGAEAPIEPATIRAFDNIRALSRCNDDPARASRPFDLERDGFVLGEGAAVLVLEEMEVALRRGARIYGRVRGYATTTDAWHRVSPRPDVAQSAAAVRRALGSAGIPAEAVDCISAHATSTPIGDVVETRLIRCIHGERAPEVPVYALKSITGHASGAAGAMQAATSFLMLRHQTIVPTVNLHSPDPECDLDYVLHTPRPAKLDVVVQHSFGFSGKNSVLVLST